MSEDDCYGDLDDCEEIDEIDPCDYGLDDGEGCVNPSLRNINCCFECWLFQESCEEQEKEIKELPPRNADYHGGLFF